MLAQIDRNVLAEILTTVQRTYTGELGWEASDDETYIEGAVVDAVHGQLFNGEPPPEFAVTYPHDPTEAPRKTLTRRRQQEIRNLLQANWRGAGGAILAEEMIAQTLKAVIKYHKERHSLEQ